MKRKLWLLLVSVSWARPQNFESEKTILMPDLDATCSLDLGCDATEFAAFCDAHPDRTVVVYANTSAAVKDSCGLDGDIERWAGYRGIFACSG